MTYFETGVDYDTLDAFKRLAQTAAAETADNIIRLGLKEYKPSRGESVYLVELPDCYIALVEEGLGTKNLVADAMYAITGKTYYDQVAQCTVAMNVNDMITLGALPFSTAMHIASGDSDWFGDEERNKDLVRGWRNACRLARCTWGGGETPTLKGIVIPGTVVLSVSAVGIIKPKSRLIRGNVRNGDAIVLISSSGIHANGLTLARKIAEGLPDGYLTKLPDGRSYGETLLDPTLIYVRFIEECFWNEINIHYAVNITGHGWRKLMRLPDPYAYIIEELPLRPPIFDFIQEHGDIDDREAYANLNMGAGFALYVPQKEVSKVLRTAKDRGYEAMVAGHIERSSEKKVVLQPLGIEYLGTTLQVR